MAGLFAVRALRAGREKFDPFGERSSSGEETDDLDDVEEAEPLNSDDEKLAVAAPLNVKSKWEVNAAEAASSVCDDAVDVDDEPPGAGSTSASATKATTTAAPGLAALGSAWETTCELIYEDDDAEVFCVRFSPDDRLLASGCGDGVVRVFHVDDGRLAYTLEREGDVTRLPITCLRWRPSSAGSTQNVLLAANADGTVCHWHVTSRKIMHTITEADNQVYALDYAPDGASFATAGKDYAVRVYDENTRQETAKLASGWIGAPSAGHSNRIFSLKFVPDEPNLLASAGWDNTIQLWDLRQGSPVSSMFGPHVCGDAIDISGHELVSGSWRPTKQLQIWDVRKCELLHDVPFRHALLEAQGEACNVYAAQFSKPSSGRSLIAAGGSGSNELKLFERESMQPIGRMRLPRGVYGVDLSHDGTLAAVAGGDCKVRALRVPGAVPGTTPTHPQGADASAEAALVDAS